jgi:hypothetical protein
MSLLDNLADELAVVKRTEIELREDRETYRKELREVHERAVQAELLRASMMLHLGMLGRGLAWTEETIIEECDRLRKLDPTLSMSSDKKSEHGR